MFQNCHFLPVAAMPADWPGDATLIFSRTTINYRTINLFYLPCFKKFDQCMVGPVILGNHHHPGGVFVQPVHYTRALRAVNAGKIITPVQQAVHQGALLVAAGRMNNNTRRLGNYHQVIILMNYGKIHMLRHNIHRLGRWNSYLYLFICLQTIA